jgi:tryptophan synthase alpha chain
MNVMSQRVEQLFARCRAERRAAFIPYICAGDPTLDRTVEIARALENSGADLLELGVPFSDPLADGIVNQLAAQRALQSGTTVRGVLDCVRTIRQRSQIPIVLYTYLNPILQFGFKRFHEEASDAGVDGLLLLDLPPEELAENDCRCPIHIALVAPTTPPERLDKICARAAGFIYYVSREGVTGAQSSIVSSLAERIALLRNYTALPIAVGFGISNAAQARAVAQVADSVVVGSAIVDQIAQHANAADLSDRISEFVAPIAAAVRSSRK